MIKKKYFWLIPFIAFSLESNAKNLPDRPSQVIYSPTVISKELCDITNNYATNNLISKKKIDPN